MDTARSSRKLNMTQWPNVPLTTQVLVEYTISEERIRNMYSEFEIMFLFVLMIILQVISCFFVGYFMFFEVISCFYRLFHVFCRLLIVLSVELDYINLLYFQYRFLFIFVCPSFPFFFCGIVEFRRIDYRNRIHLMFRFSVLYGTWLSFDIQYRTRLLFDIQYRTSIELVSNTIIVRYPVSNSIFVLYPVSNHSILPFHIHSTTP